MIPAPERFVVSIPIVPLDRRVELPPLDRLEKVPKNAIPDAHARPFCVSTTRKGRCESVRPSMHRDIVNHFFPGQPCACGGGNRPRSRPPASLLLHELHPTVRDHRLGG